MNSGDRGHTLGPSATAVVEQACYSGTNLLISLALARVLDAAAFGAYSIGFGFWVVGMALVNAMIFEPILVLGQTDFRARRDSYLGASVRAYFVLTLVVGIAVAVPAFAVAVIESSDAALAVASAAVALPGFGSLWLARRLAYVVGAPGQALASSVFYAASSLLLMGVALAGGRRDAASLLLIVGVSSFAAAVPRLRRSTAQTGTPLGTVVVQHWRFGRWLVIASFLTAANAQIPTVVVSALLSVADAGALVAMANIAYAVTQLQTAVTSVALPTTASAVADGGPSGASAEGAATRSAVVASVAVAVASATVLAMFHRPIAELVYGTRLASHSELMALMASAPVIAGFAARPMLALRARRRTAAAAGVAATVVAATVASTFVLVLALGLTGAALAAPVASLVSWTASRFMAGREVPYA